MSGCDLVFVTSALREVTFFGAIATRLRDRGVRTVFVNLYEPGDRVLQAGGHDVFSVHKARRRGAVQPLDEAAVAARIDRPLDDLLRHEMLTFNRMDRAAAARKFALYSALFDGFLAAHRPRFVVHELGAFIGQLALYHAARAAGVRHVFLEPGLSPARLFLLHDRVDPVDLRAVTPGAADQTAGGVWIAAYNRAKPVAMPQKDRHHFRDATLGKFVNRDNLGRLGRKVWAKYVRREAEEFDAIGNHVRRALGMYWHRRGLAPLYTPGAAVQGLRPYLYYPLHVPLDIQLTFREPRYLDQIDLLARTAALLPPGWTLLTKEHPAAIGAYAPARIRTLLAGGRVRLLHPSLNSYDLIRDAAAVVTVNSKVGAEAILQRRPVLALGRPVYAGLGLTRDLTDLGELPAALASLHSPDAAAVDRFAAAAFAGSAAGELYVDTPDNLAAVTAAIAAAVAPGGPPAPADP